MDIWMWIRGKLTNQLDKGRSGVICVQLAKDGNFSLVQRLFMFLLRKSSQMKL
jgi:hypothetical protein